MALLQALKINFLNIHHLLRVRETEETLFSAAQLKLL
jgi:hypothetical protein